LLEGCFRRGDAPTAVDPVLSWWRPGASLQVPRADLRSPL